MTEQGVFDSTEPLEFDSEYSVGDLLALANAGNSDARRILRFIVFTLPVEESSISKIIVESGMDISRNPGHMEIPGVDWSAHQTAGDKIRHLL